MSKKEHLDKEEGLYETIVTQHHREALKKLPPDLIHLRDLGPSESPRRIADYFGRYLESILSSIPRKESPEAQIALVNDLITTISQKMSNLGASDDEVTKKLLTAIGKDVPPAPQLPLSESGLYVNANRERSLDQALRLECESADQIDLICAFLFWTGYVRLRPVLMRFLEQKKKVRILTTTYCGVTQARVLDDLQKLGAEIRVSYETGSTRLHAKAWILHRSSGFGTAFVGSSNLSHSALTAGREWNVRLSQIENAPVIEELKAAFENHWSDEEFQEYDSDYFRRAQREERPTGHLTSTFALKPKPFQQIILDRVQAEREIHGRHKNLIVSATGTGKTVVAALDYQRLCAKAKTRLKLLFVAHRDEILRQSQNTFRHAMSDGSFGERFVGGERPLDMEHVFGSVQSLANQDLEQWPKDHFDVIIIDEFHHARSTTYERLLDYFEPEELLGLTATPERHDGKSILEWFDGAIASELRLWDAIDRGLLVPFQYFCVHDTVDLTSAWHSGNYDRMELERIFTAHDARSHLIIKAIEDTIHDTESMRALAFCANVGHAKFTQKALSSAGISCAVVTGETGKVERANAIRELRNGQLSCITTVDVFNEGVDIPEVDTLLLLRPTESATVFLQQLGRGLRLFHGKRCLTVLDFVSIPHGKFRYSERFRALLGNVGRQKIKKQILDGFPYLPSGCSLQMDRKSQEIILENIASSLRIDRPSLRTELADSGAHTLEEFLDYTGMELVDLYRNELCFSELKRSVGLDCPDPGPQEAALARGLGRLVHIDDPTRLDGWISWLSADTPVDESLGRMLLTTIMDETAVDFGTNEILLREHPAICEELVELLSFLRANLSHFSIPLDRPGHTPLRVHAHYRRTEIMAAFDDVRNKRLYIPREGVHFDKASKTNLFFVTLTKDEDDYSPSTMYNDYAMGPKRFHWQSQSGTRASGIKGLRHINHEAEGITPLLFVRTEKKDVRGVSNPFILLGRVSLITWLGERPMNIEWELQEAIPAEILSITKVIV